MFSKEEIEKSEDSAPAKPATARIVARGGQVYEKDLGVLTDEARRAPPVGAYVGDDGSVFTYADQEGTVKDGLVLVYREATTQPLEA